MSRASPQNHNMEAKPEITIDDFAKLDLRVGKIVAAEAVEGSDKLIKETVDFGELGERTILSGIRKSYEPEDLVGKHLMFIVNLPPRAMMGIESEGMLVAASDEEGRAVLYEFDKEVPAGTSLK